MRLLLIEDDVDAAEYVLRGLREAVIAVSEEGGTARGARDIRT